MKKSTKRNFLRMGLGLLGMLFGAVDGSMMAMATPLEDGGNSNGGSYRGDDNGNGTTDGIATETQGRADGDPEMYSKDIDQRITKIRPMATPIDQISRYGKYLPSDSFVVKYYSVGTRPISTTLDTALTGATNAESQVLTGLADPTIFTLDDTIRVVGVKALTKADGTTYNDSAQEGTTEYLEAHSEKRPDLVLCVCGRDSGNSNAPVVYAVNGKKHESLGTPICLPDIPAGTKLIRMGKACGELDVQTGRFNNLPTSEEQYCQNFMIQIEQSTFDKIAKKEVDWGFSDIEEDGIYDMRLAQENTFLFGAKNRIKHSTKDNMDTWFTGGIWYQAGKDITVGHWDKEKSTAVISDDNLVEISKDLFVGTGIGNKRKVLLVGSDMLEAFSKIESEKFRLKDNVESWNLKFKSWNTDFGELLLIHHELFDLNGMPDYGFALDPEYLTKKTHVSWTRNVLDLKKAGIRNTDAVVIQEVACLYLRYAKAHARMRLATEND